MHEGRIFSSNMFDWDSDKQIIPHEVKRNYKPQLSSSQKDMIRNVGRVQYIQGVAGSGKTAVILEKIEEKAQELLLYNEGKKIAYITWSDYLRDEVKNIFQSRFPGASDQKVHFLTLRELLNLKSGNTAEYVDDEILYNDFIHSNKRYVEKYIHNGGNLNDFIEALYGVIYGKVHDIRESLESRGLTDEWIKRLEHFDSWLSKENKYPAKVKRKLDVESGMHEYLKRQSFSEDEDELKEFKANLSKLYRDDYITEKNKCEKPLLHDDWLKDAHEIVLRYSSWKKSKLSYLDLVKSCCENRSENVFDYLYVDEIQDMTDVELRMILSFFNTESDGSMIFTGDVHQKVKPSYFQWGTITKLIQSKNLADRDKPSSLGISYRCDKSVYLLAYRLQCRREKYGRKMPDWTKLEDPTEYFNKNSRSNGFAAMWRNFKLLEMISGNSYVSTHYGSDSLYGIVGSTVITLSQKSKSVLAEYGIRAQFIYTVEESKGREWDKVLVLLPLSISEEGINLEILLDYAYTACTRARKEVLFVGLLPNEFDDLAPSIDSFDRINEWAAEVQEDYQGQLLTIIDNLEGVERGAHRPEDISNALELIKTVMPVYKKYTDEFELEIREIPDFVEYLIVFKKLSSIISRNSKYTHLASDCAEIYIEFVALHSQIRPDEPVLCNTENSLQEFLTAIENSDVKQKLFSRFAKSLEERFDEIDNLPNLDDSICTEVFDKESFISAYHRSKIYFDVGAQLNTLNSIIST
jgi:hypothetical protein